MIVVTGNWLFSDETLVPPPAATTVERFLEELSRLACLAGIAADGTYRPIERIDIVLAGDTFDGLVSRRWLGRLRPWRGSGDSSETTGRILLEAIRSGRRPLERLRGLVRSGIMVPSSDARRRPVLGRQVAVPVRVAILPGDRDAPLAHPLAEVASRLGFDVGTRWERLGDPVGRVFVRHGHEFDPLCGIDGDDVGDDIEREQTHRVGRRPSISESLAIDWCAAFAAGLAETPCPPAVAGRIVRDISAAPWTAAPATFVRDLIDASLPAGLVAMLVDAWRRSVERWHAAATADPPCSQAGFDAVGALAAWLERIGPSRLSEPGPPASGACADGWLDIRRQDLAAATPRAGLAVLGHPPRGLSEGAVIALGPAAGGHDAGAEAEVLVDACKPRPVVEIRAMGRSSAGGPAWVAIPRSDGTGGLVSSNEWSRAAA